MRLGPLDRIGPQLREHLHEDSNDGRIERRRRLPANRRHRLGVAHRGVVRAIRRQRVEVVDHREDPRAERYLFALQTVRITLPVPPLMVREDERGHRVGEGHGGDDLRADLRVDLHLPELFLREGARLRQDVLGHRELADVVQQCGRAHALHLLWRHADGLRNGGSVPLHTADVRGRGLVLGVYRERQGLDRGQVKLRELLEVACGSSPAAPPRGRACDRRCTAARRR